MKDQVRISYNTIAERYAQTRKQFSKSNNFHLELLNTYLKSGSTVLDLGCGSGFPVSAFFANKGHKVIGLDISEKQIELAKSNVPDGQFEVGDIETLHESAFKVDAVLAFYSIFHISRDKHAEIITRIASFLSPGGMLLITMGAAEWEGNDNFLGVKMFWSHWGQERNTAIVLRAGFKIIINVIDHSGEEEHQVILAQLKSIQLTRKPMIFSKQ